MAKPIERFAAFLMFAAALAGIAGCKSDIWADQPLDVVAQYRVPNSAKVVAAGTGTLEMTAPEQGIIYVVDRDDQRTIKSKNGDKKLVYRVLDKALLLKSQTYFFDPNTGTAGLRSGERATVHVQATPGHHYELRFDTKELKD